MSRTPAPYPTETGSYGYLFAFTSSFSAGAATVLGKWNLDHISSLLMNGGIFGVAAIVLTIGIFSSRKSRPSFAMTGIGWIWLAAFTAVSIAAVFAYWTGVQKMDPSLAAFINRFEVPIAIMLGIIFLKERFTITETLGAVLSFAGIVIMRLTLRVEYTEGFWWVLAGAVFFGLTEFTSKKAVRHVDPVVLTYIRNCAMAGIFWVTIAAVGEDFGGLNVVWLGVIGLGLLGPIGSRLSYLLALRRLELSKVAVISQSQPVFVILIALLLLGQLPTFREITGGLCLTAGSLLMIVGRYRFKRPKATADVRPDR
ncbi:EamA family transporter [candidate division GN15 bacterium]|nr:EamA family transporter [candidate division GN15 bacterium]